MTAATPTPTPTPTPKPSRLAVPGDLVQRLPHGPAFRFITRVDALKPGGSGRGVWALTGGEPFFAGHFPGEPIVPGVLLGEALAQLSGLVAWADREAGHALLAQLDIKLKRAVAPPADVTLESTLTRQVGSLTQFDVKATVNGDIAAVGSLTLANITPDALPAPDAPPTPPAQDDD